MVIAFEGSHRSGKGTQIELLKEELESKGKEVIVVHEPCGTEEANKVFIEELFSEELTSDKELERFQEERLKLYESLKKTKEYKQNAVILVDRTVLSLEIQRIKGANEKEVRQIQEDCLSKYDLILVLDMEKRGIDNGYAEVKRRDEESRFGVGGIEEEGQRQEFNPFREGNEKYHRSLIEFYHQVAEGVLFPNHQEKIVGINALAKRETVHQRIREVVDSKFYL